MPEHPGETEMSEAALEVTGVSKRYGGSIALDNVSARFEPGTIYGLVGINGSGKSTLIKIVAGIEAPTALDSITFYGRRVKGDITPALSHRMGVRVLHQRPAQFLDLCVTENLLLPDVGRGQFGVFNWSAAHKRVRRILDSAGMDLDPRTRFDRYSPAQRTMALIARLLYDDEVKQENTRRIVILDEPTAALPEAEAMWLIAKLKSLKAAGHTIIYVSHRLDELFCVTDELIVLRAGRLIGTQRTPDTNEASLVSLLLGHEMRPADVDANRQPSASYGNSKTTPRIEVKGLHGKEATGVDFAAAPGEIVGLTGLIGSGFLETLEMVFGMRRQTSGSILLDGKPLDARHPRDAMRAGIAMVPRDRTELGVFASWSVKDNLTAPQFSVPVACDLDPRRVIDQYGIKTRSPAANIWTLSGGNQQKVVLARWLQRNPRLLLLCEPTAGVDPAARDDLHALLRASAAKGCTILVASTDADELESLAHRTLVLNRGRITSEIEGGPGSKERIREKIL